MPNATPRRASQRDATLASISSFGEFLKYLRRRARLTQDELGRAVGYSREQITRLERNQRLPDTTILAALFVPALALRDDPEAIARFLELAAQARGEQPPSQITLTRAVETRATESRDAHRNAAEWAELAQGDVLQAAREYGLAGDFKRAADLLTDQGTLLFNQGKADATSQVIDELVTQMHARDESDADILRRLLTTRGDVLLNTTRADEAEANYRTALDLAGGAVRATLVYRLAVALTQRGRAAEALALTKEMLEQLEPQHLLLRAQLKIVEAGANMALSRFDRTERANLDALALADQFAVAMPMMAAGIRARAHNTLGAIYAIRGQRDSALQHWQNAVATAQLAGFRALEYRAQGNLANLYFEQGALDAAERACDAALVGLQSINDLQAAAKFIHLRANLHFVRGEIAESLARAQEACALKQQLGDRNSYLASLHQQVKALIVLGRLDEARGLSAEGLQEVESIGDQRTRGYWLTTLSEIEMLEGKRDRAQEILEAVGNLPGAAEDSKLSSDCANHLALAALMRADATEAERLLAGKEEGEVEISLESDLIASLTAWVQHDHVRATQMIQNVVGRAHASGYRLLERRAKKTQRAFDDGVDENKLPMLVYGKV